MTSAVEYVLPGGRSWEGLPSALGENAKWAVSTLCASRPGFKEERARTVRPSIPAETSNTSANAISAMTNGPCRRREFPVTLRPPERSASCQSMCGNTQRWRQSENETAYERNPNSKAQYAPVDMDLFSARQVTWPESHEWMHAKGCRHDAQQTAAKA